MNTLGILALAVLATACSAAVAFPQSASTTSAHGVWSDGAGASGVGAGYKVAFVDGAMRWTPALGPDAPRGRSLRLEYRALRRGPRLLHERSPKPPELRLRGHTVSFVRSATLIERWEVCADAVALSYEFASRPQGTGDLIVTLDLGGDYGLGSHTDDHGNEHGPGSRAFDRCNDHRRGWHSPDGGGMVLHSQGAGSVRIGAVTGIDATGVSCPGTVRVVDGTLELSLPAGFVDAARYPMVLDPRIGSDILIGGTTDFDGAVAFDDALGIWLVVWQRTFSATDIDIYGQRVDRAGQLVGPAFPIAAPATGIAKEPAVCQFQWGSGLFLVVWSQTPALFAAADVYGACVPAAAGPASPAAPLAASPSRNEDRPRLAARAESADRAFLLWVEDGIALRAGYVHCPSPTSPPALVPPFLLSQTSGHADGAAADSEPGLPGVTIYADRNGSAASAGTIYTYDDLGNLIASAPLGSRGVDGSNFAVARSGTEQLLVYDVQEAPGTTGPRDVYAQKIVVDGSLAIRSIGPPTPIAAIPGRDEFDPAVAFLGSKFVIAWSAASATTLGSYDLVTRTIDPETCLPCGRDEVIAPGGLSFDGRPAIASERGAGGTGDRALIVFQSGELVPPFRGEVRAQLFEAIGGGGRVGPVGGGCGNGGRLRLDGPFAIGNRGLRVELNGADTVASRAFLMIGLPGAPVPCGSCAATTAFTFFPSPVVGGAARVPFGVPCQPDLIGGTLELQWWTLGTGSTPCPLVRGMAFTDRVQATIGT